MKLINLSSIESAFARRLALVLHAPVVAWTAALFLFESVVNTVRSFVVDMVHVVANFVVGALTAVSAAGQNFADFVTNGVRQIAHDIAFVWRGGAKMTQSSQSVPAPLPTPAPETGASK